MLDHIKTAVSTMDDEALEVAFKDAMKRASDGREINNEPYVERQEAIAKIISDEILNRLLSK
jgi:hypothetical protein